MFSFLKSKIGDILNPLTSLLVKLGLKPNHITILGLATGFFSAYLIATKNLLYGGLIILLSGFLDMLDGALARNQTLTTKFGGFLDSVFDRYVDVAIFLSLGIYGVNWVYVVLAMSGALLVSYTRARAEKIIERCDVGIAERGERLVIIFFGIVTGYLVESVLIVAFLSHLTAIQRIYYTRKLLEGGKT